VQKQYIKSWLDFKTKDNQVRLIMSQIHRSIKNGQPHRLSTEEIEQFNQAREAWFKFLRVARR
jgi:hypothetical protein